MSMLSKRTTIAVLLAATGPSACVAAPNWVKPMTAEQTDAVRETCGPIPPRSRVRAGGEARSLKYRMCKQHVLENPSL
jgi:hypothetical protein